MLHADYRGGRMHRRKLWPAVVVIGMLAVSLPAQELKPAFEVASVRRAVPGTTGGRVQFLPDRFVAENVPLDFLLQQVYGVRAFQILAAPPWKAIIEDGRDSRYQIQAKADDAATPDQVKEMVKALLADRFGLRLHKETRELPVYALTQVSGGAKGAREANGPPGGITLIANGWIRGRGVTVPHLVETLSRSVDRPIVDRTNLTHVLDFDLTWTPLATGAAESATGCPSDFQEMASRMKVILPSNCPSIFTALQDQMGLRLNAQNAPLDVLVIDAVQQPTEN
jgi:uncharacterized protein (TIGR03435 family)